MLKPSLVSNVIALFWRVIVLVRPYSSTSLFYLVRPYRQRACTAQRFFTASKPILAKAAIDRSS